MESREPSISSYFGHLQFGDDEYFRYNLNDERERSMSDSAIFNDEFIKFRFKHMKDSINEHMNCDKMAEEYEQRRLYEEVEQEKINVLAQEYGINYQLMCQQYQIQAMHNQNNEQVMQLLQSQLQNGLMMLREEYLKQRDIIVNGMEDRDQLKIEMKKNGNENYLRDVKLDEMEEYIKEDSGV